MRATSTLNRIFQFLAESSLHASDEEILQDAGADAPERAERIRRSLLFQVKCHKQRLLDEATLRYREQLRRFREQQFEIPATPEERRLLLSSLFERLHAGENLLTIQHRKFQDLSDSDVESCLRQLQALGALNEAKKEN